MGGQPPLSVGAATAAWRAALDPDLVGTESIALPDAAGRVLAAPVRALVSVPSVPCAAMDGIAVLSGPSSVLAAGAYDVVDTGDPLPPGRDAVVMREHLRRRPDGAVRLREPARPGQHVRPVGESVAAGEELVPAGRVLRPADLAVAAAGGHRTLEVRRRPVVAIVPTGDEVRPLGTDLAPGELLDTNSLFLGATLRGLGCTVHVTPIRPDDPGVIGATVRDAAVGADLVLVLAGSSAGRDDHTASVLRSLGTVVVQGVAVRPGHPVLLGVLAGPPPVPVVGVPGYPVSAAVALELFAVPLLADLQGRAPAPPQTVEARLSCAVASPAGVEEYLLVTLPGDGTARPLPRGAGAHAALARADAVLRVEPCSTGHAAGETVPVLPVGSPGWAGPGAAAQRRAAG